MSQRFSSFVIFAGMRTGSNFLEESLNEYTEIQCYGEAFNPHFVGKANSKELLGVSLQDREGDPLVLLDRMKTETTGLPGFRFFFDHDQRVFEHCLQDNTCAKIILTRNPVESYVSREIARKTGQWRLGDATKAKSATVRFLKEDFQDHLDIQLKFQDEIQNGLQKSGQTAFHISYDDLADVEILNGLARFLGLDEAIEKASQKTKKQNPTTLKDKVENYPEMVSSLSGYDYFALADSPGFEPRRGPAVSNYVAGGSAPLLFMPIKSGPYAEVVQWLADFDGGGEENLIREFSQKSLRHWKRNNKGHRSFAVVRHPVARLFHAFSEHIVNEGPQQFDGIKQTLIASYGVKLPQGQKERSDDQLAAAFIAFAKAIKTNLAGQTSFRTDPSWCSQSELLRGMSDFASPDHVFREDTLAVELSGIANLVGLPDNQFAPVEDHFILRLNKIYNDEIEAAVKSAYQKDYMMFGFKPWSGD